MAASQPITRLMSSQGSSNCILYLTSPDNTPCTYILAKLERGPAPDKLLIAATIEAVEQLSLIITTPSTSPSAYLSTPYLNVAEGTPLYDTIYNLVIIAYSKLGNPPVYP